MQDGNDILAMEAIHLTHADWEISVFPNLGGKIFSIRWRGVELISRNPRKQFRPAQYGAPFEEFDASGFDECFPTIESCRYPEYPWKGVELPDHGELWSLPWLYSSQADQIRLEVCGIRIPYRFEKVISIIDNDILRFSYRLTNPTPFPFKYIWSSHPLLAIHPGMRIQLPSDTTIQVSWSKGNRLGVAWKKHPWPFTHDSQGKLVDLSQITGPEMGLVDKLYTDRLREGWCALYDPSQKRYAAFVFPTKHIPFVGLSINLGGWPIRGSGYYNLGLEPCSGYPDRLDLAIRRGAYSTIRPQETVEWEMAFTVGYCKDEMTLADHIRDLPVARSYR